MYVYVCTLHTHTMLIFLFTYMGQITDQLLTSYMPYFLILNLSCEAPNLIKPENYVLKFNYYMSIGELLIQNDRKS